MNKRRYQILVPVRQIGEDSSSTPFVVFSLPTTQTVDRSNKHTPPPLHCCNPIEFTNHHMSTNTILPPPKPPQQRRPNVLITGTPGTGKTTLAARIVERLNQPSSQSDNDDNNETTDDIVVVAKHINVGEFIQTHQFYDGYDDILQTYILDEDPLLDALDELFIETMTRHDSRTESSTPSPPHNHECDTDENYSISLIADYHICEIFPERYFDLVLVLRTDTERLYDRYMARNYHHPPPNHNNDDLSEHTTTTPSTTPPTTTTSSTTPPTSTKMTHNLQCEIMNVILEQAQQSYAPEIVIELPSNTIEDMESNVQRVILWIEQYMMMMNHQNNTL